MIVPGQNPGAADDSNAVADGKSVWTRASRVGLALVGLVLVALTVLTWRKWPDPVIDFGTQLYIPWRITQGAVLYRDLFYFAGSPLSQYFNALLFKIFGVSFSVLIAANLTFLSLILYFIYRRFLAASDALTATAICVGILVVFAFAQYTATSNYNYLAPYSHEAIHGCFLSLFVLGLLTDWLARQRLWPAVLAGFFAGMVFLTKPDVFLALMAGCATALCLHAWRRGDRRFAVRSLTLFGAAALVAPFAFFLIFLRSEDWRTSLHSITFGWVPLFVPAVRNNRFYLWFRGMENPAAHLLQTASHFLCAVLAIIVYTILFRRLHQWASRKNKSPQIAWLIWLALVSPLVVWALFFDWIDAGSSLPLWCLLTLGILVWQFKQRPGSTNLVFLILWTVFSLFIMSKLGFRPRIWQVGFILAMPAFAITLYFLLWLMPRLLEKQYQAPAGYLRAALLLALLVGAAQLFQRSQQFYATKGQPVGRGGDKILVFGPMVAIGEGVKIALDWVDQNIPADGTLAVLPSGVNLNYLSRRVNPTPCLFWDPNSMAVFGQDKMTALFEASPPDYILVIEQDQSEFGVRYLGQSPGYGVDLMQWIKRNYRPAVIIGNEPLRDGKFGMEFWKHRPPSAEPTPAPSKP